ncbi:MAG: hypothetical protein F4209_11800 [Chloroflexi bacterium]|nr:hypothetical protein [Chloroflexota bacterium]MYF23406.1 hypothetical protein [Chloroflexota bacterium]
MSDGKQSRVRVRYLGDEPLVMTLASEEILRLEPDGPLVAVLSEEVELLIARGDFEIEDELSD